MNNTKWRKLFSLLGNHPIKIQVLLINSDEYSYPRQFSKGGERENHVSDFAMGTCPFEYKMILNLRIVKHEDTRNPKTGVSEKCQKVYNEFKDSLDILGQFPLSEDDEYLYINGYEK